MQRRNSLSSTPSVSRADARDIRDTHTDSLMALDQRFVKKSRKSDPQLAATARSYCFPNGEVFRPRHAPAKRNKPAKLPTPEIRQEKRQEILRSGSMVLVLSMNSAHLATQSIHSVAQSMHSAAPSIHSTAPSMQSTVASMHSSVPYITQSPLFNNLKLKLKQDLVLLIRNTKADTPTNINISYLTPAPAAAPASHPFQPRLFLLTNNRYMENSTNIVRLEQLLHNALSETFVNGKPCGSDLNPSSLSNYNLNRSNSNTPQTLVSTSENVNDMLHPDECASSSSLQKSSSLVSIQESSAAENLDSTENTEKSLHHEVKTETDLETAAGSPSVETVGLDQDAIASDLQVPLASPTNNSLPVSKSTPSPSSLDISAYDSANEFASIDERQSHEHEGSEVEQDFSESTRNASETTHENNEAALAESSPSPIQASTAVTQLLLNGDNAEGESGSDLPREATQSESRNSPEIESVIPNAQAAAMESSDESSEGCHDTSEYSQPNSRDVSHETIDTTQSFDITTDLTTLSSAKPADLVSIANSTSNDLPEPTIKLEPAGKNKSSAKVSVSSRSGHGITENAGTIDEEMAGSIPLASPADQRSLQIQTPSPGTTIVRGKSISRLTLRKKVLPPASQTLLQRVSSLIFTLDTQKANSPSEPAKEANKPEKTDRLENSNQLVKQSANEKSNEDQTPAAATEETSSDEEEMNESGLEDSILRKVSEGRAIAVQYRPVKSLLGPVDGENLRQVNHEFSKRKNIDLRLQLSQDENATITENLPDAPTPISKSPALEIPPAGSVDKIEAPARRSPEKSEIKTPTTDVTHRSKSETPKEMTPSSIFSFKPGEETLFRKPSSGGSVVSVSALYSQGQIEKFLADDQDEVPPRGDLDIKGSQIKVHKRNPSSISSMNSILQGRSPMNEVSKSGENPQPSAEDKKPIDAPEAFLQLQNRLSLLNVVDVDFDKSLPPTPERKDKYTGRFSLLGDPLASPIKSSLPQRKAPKVSPISERHSLEGSFSSETVRKSSSMANFKKVFGLFGSETKTKKQKATTQKLANKSLMTSLKNLRVGTPMNAKAQEEAQKARQSKQPRASQSLDDVSASSKTLKPSNKRKKFMINLKIASANRIEELPSPVYSVRERSATPEVPPLERSLSTKFDLPKFEIENDTFDDLLLKFDEVEKEAEMEVEQQLTSPKLLSGLFLKDDELTRAQIVDQQRNDNQLSDESLPRKFQTDQGQLPRTVGDEEEEEEEPISEQNFSTSDSFWPTEEEALSNMKDNELVVELPSVPGEQRILLTKEGLFELLSEGAEGPLPSYLKHIKQFLDFEQIEIKLKDFDPNTKEEVVKSEGKVSPILKDGLKNSSGSKSVKFSSTISISETFPPFMYKRYNKSVTQYYLTEFAEVNRIKNELNAYKCHEMLVHEKSQMNTHFFY